MKCPWFIVLILLLASSCMVRNNGVRNSFNPGQKYSPQELKEDYHVFRTALEESHPGLYWYTPKDSVDYYFKLGEQQLNDSMTEYRFRSILSYTLAKIRCGHTTVRASERATNYAMRYRGVSFPLGIKAWDDTVVVTSNLNRKDSLLKRGTVIESIEGRPISFILDSLFNYISADGYNQSHKYQVLSNPGVFRNLYSYVFGLRPKMKVEFMDSLGTRRTVTIPFYDPSVDTPRVRLAIPPTSRKEKKRQELDAMRNLRVDTSLNTAFLEVNTFSKGNKLRGFFRGSFKEIHKRKLQNLVVDMRGNGGGSVVLSNLLTKYIADKPFKIADSLYALKRRSTYPRYMQDYFENRLFLVFMTHKKRDGYYHFTLFEQKYFKPKRRYHFNGTTYILTGGNTFSAAALFTKALVNQPDVYVVGEETGGGAYGNSAWLIPDITLPHTKVRFRLPLFRLVIDKNATRGRGVIPEVEVKPTVEAIRRNEDFKMDKVLELIRANQKLLTRK